MGAICERPKILVHDPESLRLRIAVAQNALLESKKLDGGESTQREAMRNLTELIASPGGLDALISLSKGK